MVMWMTSKPIGRLTLLRDEEHHRAIHYQGSAGGACPAPCCGVLSLRGPALRAVAEAGVWGEEYVPEEVGLIGHASVLQNMQSGDFDVSSCMSALG